MALVTGIENLLPTPYPPPVQPVFTKKTLVLFLFTLYIKRSAYTPAGRGKNGAPKQVEKVKSIDFDAPISVEPTLAV